LAIASGIQALGVVLMSALIVTPAAAARFWTHKLGRMLIIAVGFSVFSGIVGAYISYTSTETPTGPWVVLVLSLITLISFIGSSKRGILARYLKAKRNKAKILQENILKAIYHYHEKRHKADVLNLRLASAEIIKVRLFDTNDLQRGLNRLIRAGFLAKKEETYRLTETGMSESKRIVRLHRLWEQYLLKRTSIDAFHVHSCAEALAHILSPELEIDLSRELGISGIPKEDF